MNEEEFPEKIMIETSAVCNYVCEGCPNLDLPRGNRHMSEDLFKNIFDEIGDRSKKVMLWNYGEPLANPKVEDLLMYTQQFPIFKVMSTNGGLLGKFDSFDFLKSLDVLVVSINGISEESYQFHQKGGDLYSVESNLPRLIEELKDSNTIVAMQTVAHNGNISELSQLEEFARKYDFDELTIKSFNVMDGKKETQEKFVPKDESISRYVNTKVKKSDYCQKGLVINWNGEVNPCCWDYKGRTILGNVHNQTIGEIWNSENINRLRERISNEQYLPICDNCFEGRIIKKATLNYEKGVK